MVTKPDVRYVLDSFLFIVEEFHRAVIRAQKLRSTMLFSSQTQISSIPPATTYSNYAANIDELFTRNLSEYATRISSRCTTLSFSQAMKEVDQELAAEEAAWASLQLDHPTDEEATAVASCIFTALFSKIDSHSELLTDQEAQKLKERLTKQSFGTGIYGTLTEEGYRIDRIVAGSPAASKPVKVGDVVYTLGNRECSSMSAQKIDLALHDARPGTVCMKVLRRSPKGTSTFTVLIPRMPFTLEEGRLLLRKLSMTHGTVAIARLDEFYRGQPGVSSCADLIEEFSKISTPAGLLLDLRFNGGGYLSEAAQFAGLFIHTGVITTVHYSDGRRLILRDINPNVLYSGPIVVLVSHQTASAAECVAQALKDYGRAIIVGDERTYGKGSAQLQTVTSPTKSLSAKFTVGYLFSVSGFSHQGAGVTADIVVPTAQRAVSHEVLLRQNQKSPSYIDSLSDVTAKNRSWYQAQYLPFVEQKTEMYRAHILALRQRSSQRLSSSAEALQDSPLQEALCVLDDLIQLSSK